MADDPLSQDEQLDIACRMLDRDQTALARLLEVYGPKVKWLLRDRLGHILNEWDIQSCLNTAAAKAWNAVYDDKKGTLGGWFYTIAYNTAVDMARGTEEQPLNRVELNSANEPTVPARAPASVEEDDIPNPVIADLVAAVKELGDKQRIIIEADLLAGGEADTNALAEKLGISKQHVYSYREKAKKALLSRMEKKGHTAASAVRRKQ